MVITIDGPAGSGKSTVAAAVAKRLGFIHLNSGALFRAVAYTASQQGISLDDEGQLVELACRLRFEFLLLEDKGTKFLVDGQDLGLQLAKEETGRLASKIAVYPKLREVLLELQRAVAENSSLVVEGRDSGTVVFPDASVKFYLDARPDIRAKRIFDSRREKGDEKGTLAEVEGRLLARDLQDSTRVAAPLTLAADAVLVDTSDLTSNEVIELVVTKIASR